MITTEMRKIIIGIGLFFLSAGPAWALQGVGALADQVAGGATIHLIGKTAPGAEVNVVSKTDDHLLASAQVEKTGEFDFRFRLKTETVNDVQIFGVDDFGVTSRVSLSEVGDQAVMILPPTIVNDQSDTSVTAVALTGRTYPGAEVTLSLTNSSTQTARAIANDGGQWNYLSDDLKAGKYTATAVSGINGLVSHPSQEIYFEIQPAEVPLISRVPAINFGVWWWLVLILLSLGRWWPIDLWTLILRLIYGVLYLLGWHRQRQKWGVVYDSVSKQPIAGAVVTLCKIIDGRSKAVEMTITNRDGEFEFQPAQVGRYLIRVSKGGYVFPSAIVKGRGSDGEYINPYHGEEFEIGGDEEVRVSIAMDKLEHRSTWWYTVKRYLGVSWIMLGWSLLLSGTVFALRIWLSSSSLFDGVILALYLGCWGWIMLSAVWSSRKTSRAVESVGGRGVPYSNIGVYEAGSGVLVQRRVSDEKGRFVLRLSLGVYRLVVTAVDHVEVQEDITVSAGDKREIKVVVRMTAK